MEKRAVFHHRLLPYLLVTPQILVTVVFFFWPASQTVWQSILREDAFGLTSTVVWFENFETLFRDPEYVRSFGVTAVFSLSVTALALSVSLLLAVMADRVIRGATVYRTFLIWP
jgi:sn-glycerol 3-phosphate transport system permease protein